MSTFKIGVIGSNGFIGRHLVSALEEAGHTNLQLFGRGNATLFPRYPYQALAASSEELINQLNGIEHLYYLASETFPAYSWNDPFIELQKNLEPFLKVMEAAARASVKHIVFLSSGGTIYGPSLSRTAETQDKQPFSPYGIIKLTIENFLRYYEIKFGIKHTIFRVSNVYGEGQDTSKGLGIINTFIENIFTKKAITIFGDGQNLRNYVYVKDVAKLMVHAVEQRIEKSEVYNLASNDTLRIDEVVKSIRKVMGDDFQTNYVPVRQSDNSFIDLDNAKLISAFPDFNFTSIEEGIKNTSIFINKQLSKK